MSYVVVTLAGAETPGEHPPFAPSRLHRMTGGLLVGFGCLFLLSALFNLAVAIRELVR